MVSPKALSAPIVKQTIVVGVFHTSLVTVFKLTEQNIFWLTLIHLWEFFTHYFGLVLQSPLKLGCFDHLISS